MPRDLTDLMERATSFAPPEPHDAADVTALAAQRQRRRTASIAGGLALAVVVAGVAGYGVTRGHATTPEPANRYKHDQTVDVSAAVSASNLAGYRDEPWSIPSVQRLGRHFGPRATYHSIDADGRLIVVRQGKAAFQGPVDVRLFAGPGQAPRPLKVPASPGSNEGRPIGWTPSFLDDGRLVWIPSARDFSKQKAGFHVTDLQGERDVFVQSAFRVGNNGFDGTPGTDRQSVSGDGYWFLVYDEALPDFRGSSYSLYTATFAGRLTRVAGDVAALAVGDGQVSWVTTDGQLVTENAQGGAKHSVPVPLTQGCHVPAPIELQNAGIGALAVSRSAIAMSESCGVGKNQRLEQLAFDLSGHLLVHVTGLDAFDPSFGGDGLVFAGLVLPGNRETGIFRYDLVAGTLARLGAPAKGGMLQAPRVAGRFVLWYDDHGGHVGEFSH